MIELRLRCLLLLCPTSTNSMRMSVVQVMTTVQRDDVAGERDGRGTVFVRSLCTVVLGSYSSLCNPFSSHKQPSWRQTKDLRKPPASSSSWFFNSSEFQGLLYLPPSLRFRNPHSISTVCWCNFRTSCELFQVRHPRCVGRITSIGKMQSNTTFDIYIAKRFCCVVNGYCFCVVDRHDFFPFLFCKIAVYTVCKS
jgi:hypothetical protein